MSQHNLSVSSADGATVRAGFNSAIQALGSLQRGSSAPSTANGNSIWLDDSGAVWALKLYDGADWVVVGYLDPATNKWFLSPDAISGLSSATPDMDADYGMFLDITAGTLAKALLRDLRPPRIAVVAATHDLSVTGTQSVSGIGFTPRGVIAMATVAGAVSRTSWGISSTSADYSVFADEVTVSDSYNWAASLVIVRTDAGVDASATITDVDPDGFTLTWVKSGSPTGTAMLMFLVFG